MFCTVCACEGGGGVGSANIGHVCRKSHSLVCTNTELRFCFFFQIFTIS